MMGLGISVAGPAILALAFTHSWFIGTDLQLTVLQASWIALLAANSGKGGTWAAVPIPLVIRLPIGVVLLIWGAPRNQRWVVPIAAMLALPALWYGSLSMGLGVIPLTTPEERRRGWTRLTGLVRRGDLAQPRA